MWAGRGVLFIVITQGPRFAEEPSFHEATFSSTDLGVCLGREESVENRAVTVELSQSEVTHIISDHISLSKARQMVMPSNGACLEREEN